MPVVRDDPPAGAVVAVCELEQRQHQLVPATLCARVAVHHRAVVARDDGVAGGDRHRIVEQDADRVRRGGDDRPVGRRRPDHVRMRERRRRPHAGGQEHGNDRGQAAHETHAALALRGQGGLAEPPSLPWCDGRSQARTQGALVWHIRAQPRTTHGGVQRAAATQRLFRQTSLSAAAGCGAAPAGPGSWARTGRGRARPRRRVQRLSARRPAGRPSRTTRSSRAPRPGAPC